MDIQQVFFLGSAFVLPCVDSGLFANCVLSLYLCVLAISWHCGSSHATSMLYYMQLFLPLIHLDVFCGQSLQHLAYL